MENHTPQEMTAKERRAIRKLVVGHCANYDAEYGCLPLDYGGCYMLDKWYTGSFCKWFRNAVLPLNPTLEAALTHSGIDTKPCKICGSRFPVNGRQAYCSAKCEQAGRRLTTARRVRRHRSKRESVTN